MSFPILYKYTSKGQKQQWQIFVKGDGFYTEEGIVKGTITRSKPTKCEIKNVGKKNETSAEDQAIKEATAKHIKKLEGGYALTLEESGKKYVQPMLAEDGRDRNIKGHPLLPWVKALFKDKTIRKFVQPKFDGIRCINEKNTLMSREGKPFVTCPHLHQNDKGVILDGELYNHTFKANFNGIISMIKQPKATPEDLEHAKKFAQLWVYDMPSHVGTFSERYEALKQWVKNAGNKNIIIVPTYEISTEEELIEWHKKFIAIGYEGAILRIDDAPYENKRTKQLIKYKDLIDEEFVIVGYEEGKGGRKGTIGKFILKHDKYPNETFKSNVKGDFKYLTKVWENRDSYISKEATVQYANRTPRKGDKGDVPRFGYVIKIDRKSYEGESD